MDWNHESRAKKSAISGVFFLRFPADSSVGSNLNNFPSNKTERNLVSHDNTSSNRRNSKIVNCKLLIINIIDIVVTILDAFMGY